MAEPSVFTRSYNSFGGTDIKATFGNRVIGTLQGISYAINREKAPIYTMGSADPRAYGRGKRAIGGSMIFIQFDSEPLMHELANRADETNALHFLSDIDSIRPEYKSGAATTVQNAAVTTGTGSTNALINAASEQETAVTTAGSDQEAAVPWYPDQLPPFDIVLTAANETGALAIMKVLGVEIMNSGFGVSIDDIVCEHSYTFAARTVIPWQTQGIHDQMLQYMGR